MQRKHTGQKACFFCLFGGETKVKYGKVVLSKKVNLRQQFWFLTNFQKKSMELKCITPWTPLMKMSVFTNMFFHKMSSLVFWFSCSTVRKFLLIVAVLHENTKAPYHCSKPCIKKSYPHPKKLSQGYQEQKKEKRRKYFFH